MPSIQFETLVTQLLLWLATVVLGWLVGRFGGLVGNKHTKMVAMENGVRALLRSELMRTHHEAVKAGFSATVDKEIMQRTYDAYHDLGGNGIATNLYEEMMSLPTHDD